MVNNAPTPLVWGSLKARVLQQQRNISVNPAWDLGAREARGDFLAIVNDDVRFDDAAFDLAARGLRWFGVVGPDRSCFSLAQEEEPRLRLARRSATLFGFGTFMCMRRGNCRPVPEEMRIWGGDDLANPEPEEASGRHRGSAVRDRDGDDHSLRRGSAAEE